MIEGKYGLIAKYYLKYNYFLDCDGIDNGTLRLWKFSDFCSRHTVGVAGDDIMFHILVFYASAFRHRRHYVFGLSVRPSVRSLRYPLLTCTWVRWSTRPTVTVLQHVRPSVRPEKFPGICQRTHCRNGLKFYMLMHLDRLPNWLVYGHGLLIFLILALFWLGETGQIWGFRAFPREGMEEMAWNFACWCILTTFRTD